MKGIIYNDELYNVDGELYEKWEDVLDAVTSDSKEDRKLKEDWATYDILMGEGFFISEPSEARPEISPNAEPANNDKNYIVSKAVREPEWSPSKLLREREKLFDDRQALEAKKRNRIPDRTTNQPTRIPVQFYDESGNPYTKGKYVSAVMGMFVIMILAIMCVLCRFH